MRMDIQEHLEFVAFFWHLLREVFLHKLSDVFHLGQPHFGFRVLVREEAPVHVLALGVASVVTRNDSIWIHHRKDPELKVLLQLVREDISLQQEVDQTVNYEA